MLNPRAFYNSRPDGYAVLEIVEENPKQDTPRRFVPLRRTDLKGSITGPLATLGLKQTFTLGGQSGKAIEALYRFPLPGDAAVTGVRVQFGDVEIHSALQEREKAEKEYAEAKRSGRQAALVTRESPDVFTLSIAGIRAGEDVVVQTDYVQIAKPEGTGWSLRIPLTTSPRFVREDEAGSRHAAGQPLAILRDPGHRFALDLASSGAEHIASNTHTLAVEDGRVRLRDGEVLPDRDCVITWRPATADRPVLRVWTHADTATSQTYFLALCAPPKAAIAKRVPREVILLVDHSGSMEGAKWEAADWAVERFLAGLDEHDSFALGLFHDKTKWFSQRTRSASPEAVREAVKFLKSSRDSGGTELGVALEQALDRPRTAETPARHVLILTDAEVSDAGRVLQLADSESARSDRRRISVLCIDSAPNEALASELAVRGGGVSRFLTSNPDEDDVTTALDEVLADWSAPVLTGLTLEVNRARAEAAGRTVALVAPGPASAIDVGDLPAGRPVWVIGRAPSATEPLLFRLRTNSEVIAEHSVDSTSASPGLKALFGADRLRWLEYVMHANHSGEELRAELARLGYETSSVSQAKVFAENAREASTKVVCGLLVRESLAAGVPCSETAFVAIRSEAGQHVAETVIVANALPHGWSDRFQGGAVLGGFFGGYASAAAAGVASNDSCLMDFDDDSGPTTSAQRASRAAAPQPGRPSGGGRLARKARLHSAPAAGSSHQTRVPATREIRIPIADGQYPSADGALLYDSVCEEGQFTSLSVAFTDRAVTVDAIDPELTILLYVGDLAAPRARMRLADVLRQGGRRPLNVRVAAGEHVLLKVLDPTGAWSAGVPAMEIVLGWNG